MTLLELQKVLGERISVLQEDMTSEERTEEIKTSDIIARLSKQMINNADVILRTDKMRGTQGIKGAAIDKVVGYDE